MIVMSWIYMVAFALIAIHIYRRFRITTSRGGFLLGFLCIFVSVTIIACSAGIIWGGLLK